MFTEVEAISFLNYHHNQKEIYTHHCYKGEAMNKSKVLVFTVLLPLLVACGGGGGDSDNEDVGGADQLKTDKAMQWDKNHWDESEWQ